ncbi:MAG TPA: hypothetical protein VK866_08500 [Acidimicrobiales bacterium]|nr:hypothetical protein [Acidimicrobiales bacterium]
MHRLLAGLVVALLLLAACSDDDSSDAADEAAATTAGPATTVDDPATTSAPTTAPPTTAGPTTTAAPATTTPPDSCPDVAPVPAGAEGVQAATVAYDGDGDGVDDTLSVFRHDGAWWVQVEWASGGSAAVTVDDADIGLGMRPLGGHDLDGDGLDEAFLALGGPASGVIVAVIRTAGCGVTPVVDDASGLPFTFPVTASIGSFSGASCEGAGDLELVFGSLVDAALGEYEAGTVPYDLTPEGRMVAGPGDGGSASTDDVGALATLDCGDLASTL